MSRVELFELRGSRACPVKIKSFDNVAPTHVTPTSAAISCGASPSSTASTPSAELFVREGRKKEYFRL